MWTREGEVRQGLCDEVVAEPRAERRVKGIRQKVQRKQPAQEPSGRGERSCFQGTEREPLWIECREWGRAVYTMRLRGKVWEAKGRALKRKMVRSIEQMLRTQEYWSLKNTL